MSVDQIETDDSGPPHMTQDDSQINLGAAANQLEIDSRTRFHIPRCD